MTGTTPLIDQYKTSLSVIIDFLSRAWRADKYVYPWAYTILASLTTPPISGESTQTRGFLFNVKCSAKTKEFYGCSDNTYYILVIPTFGIIKL